MGYASRTTFASSLYFILHCTLSSHVGTNDESIGTGKDANAAAQIGMEASQTREDIRSGVPNYCLVDDLFKVLYMERDIKIGLPNLAGCSHDQKVLMFFTGI